MVENNRTTTPSQNEQQPKPSGGGGVCVVCVCVGGGGGVGVEGPLIIVLVPNLRPRFCCCQNTKWKKEN